MIGPVVQLLIGCTLVYLSASWADVIREGFRQNVSRSAEVQETALKALSMGITFATIGAVVGLNFAARGIYRIMELT